MQEVDLVVSIVMITGKGFCGHSTATLVSSGFSDGVTGVFLFRFPWMSGCCL
jgi:hypothetical protein